MQLLICTKFTCLPWWLLVLCSFDAAGGASGAANNQALHLLAGVRPEDVIMADWHSSLSRPCHYVAVDRANQAVVLSIR